MSELTVSQLIKLLLGAFVVVAVVLGIYFGFKENFFEFFRTISIENDSLNLVGGLLR